MNRVESWLDRDQAEWQLVQVCEQYDTLIRDAYRARHDKPGYLNLWLRWAIRVGLVDEDEDTTWRRAMVLRNAILQREYRIVLADIVMHTASVRVIVDALPARMLHLADPPSIPHAR
jgi:hypothetical protein